MPNKTLYINPVAGFFQVIEITYLPVTATAGAQTMKLIKVPSGTSAPATGTYAALVAPRVNLMTNTIALTSAAYTATGGAISGTLADVRLSNLDRIELIFSAAINGGAGDVFRGTWGIKLRPI